MLYGSGDLLRSGILSSTEKRDPVHQELGKSLSLAFGPEGEVTSSH